MRRHGSTARLFAGVLSAALIFMLTPCCEVMGVGSAQSVDADHAHSDHNHGADTHGDMHGLAGHGSCVLRLAVGDDLPGVVPAVFASGSLSSSSTSMPALPALALVLPLLYHLVSVGRWRAQAPLRPTLPLYLRFARLRN